MFKRDFVPHLGLLLHKTCRVHPGKTATQVAIGKDVETAVEFFSHPLVRDFGKRHTIETLLLSKCLISRLLIRDRKSTRLHSSHIQKSRMPSAA